jgi:hypothetical protein
MLPVEVPELEFTENNVPDVRESATSLNSPEVFVEDAVVQFQICWKLALSILFPVRAPEISESIDPAPELEAGCLSPGANPETY